MTNIKTAAIIGGGIAGPVMGLALRKVGIDATIYEAYPSAAEGIGGSLALAPNGYAALEIVDAQAGVDEISVPITGQSISIGRKRIAVPNLSDAGPLRLVSRGDLYRVLQERAEREGVKVEYGKRLVAADDGPDGVVARFADGSEATADLLIGADGVHSTVRKIIDENAPDAQWTGMLGLEAEVTGVDLPVEPGKMTFAFGRNGYYLYWPLPGGRAGWGANLPYDRPLRLNEARAIPQADWVRTLAKTYGDETPGGDLVRATGTENLQVTGALWIMPSVPNWYRGRMVLVGDSVHAPSNSSGQGASLAIESAIQLARCLRDLPDVEAALSAYVRLRRSRVESVAASARKSNAAKAGPILRALLPILAPIFMKIMNVEKTQGPILRYRIDWDRPVAGMRSGDRSLSTSPSS